MAGEHDDLAHFRKAREGACRIGPALRIEVHEHVVGDYGHRAPHVVGVHEHGDSQREIELLARPERQVAHVPLLPRRRHGVKRPFGRHRDAHPSAPGYHLEQLARPRVHLGLAAALPCKDALLEHPLGQHERHELALALAQPAAQQLIFHLEAVEGVIAPRMLKTLAQLAVAEVHVLVGAGNRVTLLDLLPDLRVELLQGSPFLEANRAQRLAPLVRERPEGIARGLDSHINRRHALLRVGQAGPGVACVVEQGARLADGALRLLEAVLLEKRPDVGPVPLQVREAGVQLLAILQHDPLGVLATLLERLRAPVRAEEDDERAGGEEEGEHNHADAQGRDRQALDIPPVEEHRYARHDEGDGEQHGHDHLRGAVAQAPGARFGPLLHFKQGLVRSRRRGAVLLGQVDRALDLRLLGGQLVQPVAQKPLLGCIEREKPLAHLGHIPRFHVERPPLGLERLQLLAPGGFPRIGRLDPRTRSIEPLDLGIELFEPDGCRGTAVSQLDELAVLLLVELHLRRSREHFLALRLEPAPEPSNGQGRFWVRG